MAWTDAPAREVVAWLAMEKGELTGPWHAAPTDEDLRRGFADPAFDPQDWEPVAVPSHWRSTPAFADSDGPLLYRTSFESETPVEAEDPARTWLVFDGIFYTSDVWLDGAYLGDTEGYFFPQQFEMTDAALERREHTLALEVGCSPQRDRARKRNLTGVFQHWDLIDPDWNPGGVWRPVRLERSGPIRIRHLRVLCRDARTDQATVFVRTVLDTTDGRAATVKTTVRDENGREVVELTSERQLAVGENRLEWTVVVPNPRLWWPWSMGDQPRYNVEVDVLTEAGSSDRRSRSLGLRRIELRDWIFSINGERMFLKGANQGPIETALGAADPSAFERDVDLARDANLDLLRVHAHISRPELYEAADARGLLLWQDLPLQWGYARGVKSQARRQAREAVDLLAHHPSVVIWCGHNAPLALDVAPETVSNRRSRARLITRAALGQMLPTWNKSILDHAVASVLEKTDGSRPVIPHSGVLPHPPQLDGTDTHWYFGWYHGDERDLPRLLRWWPRVARFVSEFGAQAVPDDASFLEPSRWPDLDWEHAQRRYALQKSFFDAHVPPAEHTSFDEWRVATQRYQAELIRHQVHALRLLKYRPTGGFAQFCFADGNPAVTWSVLGHDRTPKLGFAALRDACAPTIAVVGRLPPALGAGEELFLPLHVINDRRIAISDMVAVLHLNWRTNGRAQQLEWQWAGDAPADACVRIGVVSTIVPAADDDLALHLELRDADGRVVTTYDDRSPVRT